MQKRDDNEANAKPPPKKSQSKPHDGEAANGKNAKPVSSNPAENKGGRKRKDTETGNEDVGKTSNAPKKTQNSEEPEEVKTKKAKNADTNERTKSQQLESTSAEAQAKQKAAPQAKQKAAPQAKQKAAPQATEQTPATPADVAALLRQNTDSAGVKPAEKEDGKKDAMRRYKARKARFYRSLESQNPSQYNLSESSPILIRCWKKNKAIDPLPQKSMPRCQDL